MSKIMDEMREIAEGNNTGASQKYLVRLLISWGLDITEEIKELAQYQREIKDVVEENSKYVASIKKSIEKGTESIDAHTKKIESIEKNIFVQLGVYIRKKPVVGIMLAAMIVLLSLHAFGVIIDIGKIIEEIANFLKILFIA